MEFGLLFLIAIVLIVIIAMLLKAPISAVWKSEKGEISLNIGHKKDD